MSIQREMTLQEWVDRLPSIHSAHKEFDSLQSIIAQQTERIAELEDGRAICAVADSNISLLMTIQQQAALIEKCEKALAAVESLIDQSSGVVGLHLNGDTAPWASIRAGGFFGSWLEPFDEAVAAITAQKGGAA